MATPSAAAVTQQRYPPQIKYIIGNEAAERFSFYGMRNILTVFLINYLLVSKFPDVTVRTNEGRAVFHDFVSLVYLFPLLGGFIADRFFGKYRTTLWLSLLYCVGHLLLALFDDSLPGFYTGLFLIALGAGGIKPCVSAFVGDQFSEENKGLVKGVFALFYWIINFGSFFASLTIPVTLAKFGPSVAFGIPGILMFIATVVFWLGRKHYVDVPPTGHNPHSFLRVVASALKNRGRGDGGHWLDAARPRHPEVAVEGSKAVFRVMSVFAMIPVFWALFDQKASTWVVQAATMDLTLGSATIQPSQIQALNPLFVMMLIPLNSFVLFPWLERRGLKVTALRRMGAGMFIAGFSYIAVAFIQLALDGGNQLSVLWQAGPYIILTLAEVLVSATGLEFAYTQAPREMKGTIMSFWSLCVTVGNQLVSVVSRLNVFEGMAASLFFYAGLIFAAAVVFALIARRYQVRDWFQEVSAPPLGEHSVASAKPGPAA